MVMVELRVAVLWLACGLVAAPLAAEPPPLLVLLKNGTELSGFPGCHPQESHLVIRIPGNRFVMERTVAWDEIEKLAVAGRSVSIEEVRHQVQAATEEHHLPEWLPEGAPTQPMKIGFTAPPAADAGCVADVLVQVTLVAHGAQPDPDRLLLEVTPVNELREPVMARGTLTINLFAPVYHSFSTVPRAGGTVWEPVGSWTVPLMASSWQGERFVVHLPLRSLRVDRRQLAGPFGFLHMRVVVPSQRVLERRIEWVPLAPIVPFQHQRP
ncbi:MAG: hypothetical protein KatS3mg109_0537 [Pirellulaceae bacterium]|nr:MAG: hypothetical protein KatS3mg109_0537 [Pirellulaceae bacterium]GIW94714.1 MAG: hypothetical protein KatS3mg110_2755 [Pirellulaceae bacterium]